MIQLSPNQTLNLYHILVTNCRMNYAHLQEGAMYKFQEYLVTGTVTYIFVLHIMIYS